MERWLQFRWSDEPERWRDIRKLPDDISGDAAIAQERERHESDTRRYAHTFMPIFRIEERV